jgi:perosamine synthetase
MYKKISFAGPWITQKEVDYVVDAVKNGWYETFFVHARKLEETVANYVGMKYALATHCCTLALHLSAASLGLKPGDEVICTDFSWVATAYAVSYTGAKLVFVDIDPDTWNIDPKAIQEAITDKTKAIMMVHTFGNPADMDEIMAVARKHNLAVIEDAAPALGADYKGRKVGSFGDFGCFSFHGAKVAVSGEGGILLTNSKELYDKACLLASMGRTDSQAVFWSDEIGYQYTIGNLTAALALAQVERIEELVARKRQIFGWYDERLSIVPGIQIIREKKGCKSNYCYPSILLDESINVDRDAVLAELRKYNIHFRPAFPPMSLMPAFEQRYPNPVTARVARRGISLASAANLSEEDIDFTCKTLLKILKV